MECRASLFAPSNEEIAFKSQSPYDRSRNNYNTSSRPTSRGSRYTPAGPKTPGQEGRITPLKPKSRLPLPKNVVLLSLIEASELAKETAKHMGHSYSHIHDSEETMISLSTDIATSSCGTYAVATRMGLTIVPSMEGITLKSKRSFGQRWEHKTESLIKKSSQGKSGKELNLSFGDRVQVVTIVNNCAKLARGYGYVHFTHSTDLVKVAGALDKACRTEAMIYALSMHRNELIEKKSRTEKDAVKLMHELQYSLMTHDDLTVIGAEAFPPTSPRAFAEKADEIPNDTRNDVDEIRNNVHTKRSEVPKSSNKPIATTIPISRSEDNVSKPRVIPKRSKQTSTPGQFVDWVRGFYSSDSADNDDRPTDLQHDSEVSHAMRRSAESWRKRNGREASQGIDFRTGMSGHLGVQGHHGHKYHSKFTMPKMSGHLGLTSSRYNTRSMG